MRYRYSLKPVFIEWKTSYSDLKEILFLIDETFPSPCVEREIFVEGLFLRFVTSWEYFFEEYFLRCMCTAKTIKRNIVKPVRNYNSIEESFTALANDPRKNRGNHYLDWLSTTFLKNSIKLHFKTNSRINQNVPNYFPTIKHINTIRNRVTHSSKKAEKDFDDLVRGHFGYLSLSANSPSKLLLSNYRETNIFQYYMAEINTLAERLSI